MSPADFTTPAVAAAVAGMAYRAGMRVLAYFEARAQERAPTMAHDMALKTLTERVNYLEDKIRAESSMKALTPGAFGRRP